MTVISLCTWMSLLIGPAPIQQWINAEGLHEIEQQMLDAVNADRKRNGRKELKPDMYLVKGSRIHSWWMAKNLNMSHASNLRSSENIAMGTNTVNSTQRMWMNSSGHRSNLLSSGHTHFGGSCCKSRGGTYYWTQRFKRYR